MPDHALDAPTDPPAARSQAHWVLLALAPACVLVLALLGTLISPDPAGHGTHTKLGLPPCLAMEWLGVPCPGCGVTTSVTLAAHGQLAASFLNQPLGLLVAALLALYPLWVLWQLARGRDLYQRLGRMSARLWLVGGAAAILAAWVYKLVSGFPPA